MHLAAGFRIGPYEILAPLGSGGMGDVYRARDTRLARDVAVKSLPEVFAMDQERVTRFRREAQMLAALDHPNIAGIYGIEDAPGAGPGSAHHLILELVPGVTLAQMLRSGRVALSDALSIARQITEALEAAHDRGIIHRDLKPGNIMVTPDGTVKVLDFGLARADGTNTETGSSDSPTFTLAATQAGVLLGTAAYMAPEQAKGQTADKRSDVWAFGCVLYELLTGKQAFAGGDTSDILAAVLRAEPDWTRLPPDTPANLLRLLARCLVKNRKDRIRDISIARYVIDECLDAAPGGTPLPTARTTSRARLFVVAGVAALAGAALVTGLFPFFTKPQPEVPLSARFPVAPPAGATVVGVRFGWPGVRLSQDGTAVVYAVSSGSGEQFALRRLGDVESKVLPETAGGTWPSFSPDGRTIAFYRDRQLRTLRITDGVVTQICDLPGVTGTAWLDDDTIIFASAGRLFSVAARGGTPSLIADSGDGSLDFSMPAPVPDGQGIVYVAARGLQRQIRARRLDSREDTMVVDAGTFPRYVTSGHLVFIQGGRLVSAPFDTRTLTLTGSPSQVPETIYEKANGAGNFDIAPTGTFASIAGDSLQLLSRFIVKTKTGLVTPLAPSDLEYPRHPRISPDGRRVVATIGPPNNGQIWIFDLTGATQPVKLTFSDHNLLPTWTPDGKILFVRILPTARGGAAPAMSVLSLPADGSVLEPQVVMDGAYIGRGGGAVSPDGSLLLQAVTNQATGSDLVVKSLRSPGQPRPWLAEKFHEGDPSFSPDGSWVAYISDQMGSTDVWVRPFPGPGAPSRVSPSGGSEPQWARDGKTLFYQVGGKLMSAAFTETTPLRFAQPRVVVDGGFAAQPGTWRTYDVGLDDSVILVEEPRHLRPTVLNVAVGWGEILRDRQ